MRFRWFTFGCVTSIIIVALMIIASIAGLAKLGSSFEQKGIEKPVHLNSFLHLSLNGAIGEYNEMKNSLLLDDMPASMFDILNAIEKASYDPKIEGIFMEPGAVMGISSIQVIGEKLKEFKASGKPVYAYIDVTSDAGYFASTYADKIFMTPSKSAEFLLTGVGSTMTFYKETLDKFGIEMKVIHAGKYKGYGETYSRTGLSSFTKQNLSEIINDLYEAKLRIISDNRPDLTYDAIKDLYENRKDIFINSEMALELNLVDELHYKQDVMETLGLKKENLVSMSSYIANYVSDTPGAGKIAVVYAEGGIQASVSGFNAKAITSEKMVKILTKLRKDASVKAVVIRVNSPGGSALESDIIAHAVKQLKTAKPVVVSMGSVAASGGYYISALADYIYAEPLTITGSIGVVMMLPNATGLGKKLGIHTDSVARGKYADLLNLWEPMPESTQRSLQRNAENIYSEFKDVVMTGRKIASEKIMDIAEGRVWSSTKALENGLIDEVGSIDDAVKKAAELANMTTYGTANYPKQKSLFEVIYEDKFNFGAVLSAFAKPESRILNDFDKELQKVENFRRENIQFLCPVTIDQ